MKPEYNEFFNTIEELIKKASSKELKNLLVAELELRKCERQEFIDKCDEIIKRLKDDKPNPALQQLEVAAKRYEADHGDDIDVSQIPF